MKGFKPTEVATPVAALAESDDLTIVAGGLHFVGGFLGSVDEEKVIPSEEALDTVVLPEEAPTAIDRDPDLTALEQGSNQGWIVVSRKSVKRTTVPRNNKPKPPKKSSNQVSGIDELSWQCATCSCCLNCGAGPF